ncbi:TldD/PmbA family protein [bacterium]|nr:TldD/PmbA family protein [bacterium]
MIGTHSATFGCLRLVGAMAVAIALFFAGAAHPAHAEDKDAVVSAMRAELERARTLRTENYESPYFVAYHMQSSRMKSLSARFGAIFNDYERSNRNLYVELRVGDYEMDSSGKGGFRWSFDPDMDFQEVYRRYDGPIEDDADAIRAQFWLATDQAYKNALSNFMSKKGKSIYAAPPNEEESYDDFSREEPRVHRGKDLSLAFDKERWATFLKKLSDELTSEPGLVEHEIRVTAEIETRYFVNTEGAVIVDDDALLTFYAWARAYAPDGMELTHNVVRYAGSDEMAHPFDDLRRATRLMVDELLALREAPIIDPYTGPAILDAQTTGVFFHEAIGHRLEGERMRDTQEGQTFKGKVEDPILPPYISIYDDPTLESAFGEELNGHYAFDSEGVPAERVTLVKDGVLQNFLMSRAPIPGFVKSNGHGRSNGHFDPMGRMAVTIVESARTMPFDKLKKELIAEVKRQRKPYGLILKRSQGGETSTSRVNFQAFANKPTLIYKVDPATGKETLVRGAELVGTPLVSISKIIATGEEPGVFNGFCGAESGMVPVSAIAPPALVSEIELQRTGQQLKRPPILPPPFATTAPAVTTPSGEEAAPAPTPAGDTAPPVAG